MINRELIRALRDGDIAKVTRLVTNGIEEKKFGIFSTGIFKPVGIFEPWVLDNGGTILHVIQEKGWLNQVLPAIFSNLDNILSIEGKTHFEVINLIGRTNNRGETVVSIALNRGEILSLEYMLKIAPILVADTAVRNGSIGNDSIYKLLERNIEEILHKTFLIPEDNKDFFENFIKFFNKYAPVDSLKELSLMSKIPGSDIGKMFSEFILIHYTYNLERGGWLLKPLAAAFSASSEDDSALQSHEASSSDEHNFNTATAGVSSTESNTNSAASIELSDQVVTVGADTAIPAKDSSQTPEEQAFDSEIVRKPEFESALKPGVQGVAGITGAGTAFSPSSSFAEIVQSSSTLIPVDVQHADIVSNMTLGEPLVITKPSDLQLKEKEKSIDMRDTIFRYADEVIREIHTKPKYLESIKKEYGEKIIEQPLILFVITKQTAPTFFGKVIKKVDRKLSIELGSIDVFLNTFISSLGDEELSKNYELKSDDKILNLDILNIVSFLGDVVSKSAIVFVGLQKRIYTPSSLLHTAIHNVDTEIIDIVSAKHDIHVEIGVLKHLLKSIKTLLKNTQGDELFSTLEAKRKLFKEKSAEKCDKLFSILEKLLTNTWDLTLSEREISSIARYLNEISKFDKEEHHIKIIETVHNRIPDLNHFLSHTDVDDTSTVGSSMSVFSTVGRDILKHTAVDVLGSVEVNSLITDDVSTTS